MDTIIGVVDGGDTKTIKDDRLRCNSRKMCVAVLLISSGKAGHHREPWIIFKGTAAKVC
jgi:hypothetical protein